MLKINRLILVGILLGGPLMPAAADSSILEAVCNTVDCLNNFTGKAGWSFSQQKAFAGGFTDLKTDWYVSGGPGFDVPIEHGVSVGTPLLDANLIFKVGKFATSRFQKLNDVLASGPAAGLFSALTVGVSGSYDYSQGKWFDLVWTGVYKKFG